MGLLRAFSPSSSLATLIQATIIIVVLPYLFCRSQALSTSHLLCFRPSSPTPFSTQQPEILYHGTPLLNNNKNNDANKKMMLFVSNKTHTSHHVLLSRHNLGLFFPLSHSTQPHWLSRPSRSTPACSLLRTFVLAVPSTWRSFLQISREWLPCH